MSPKLKCPKTKISLKLKSYKNWNVNKPEISHKLKCYKIWQVMKAKGRAKEPRDLDRYKSSEWLLKQIDIFLS